MKKFFRALFIASLAALMVCLAVYPDRYIPACFNGIKLWAVAVLPSLLPFFFLTTLLTSTGSLTGLSRTLNPITGFLYRTDGVCGYVQLMSFISGYPVGAKIIADLSERGVLDSDQATRASTFTSTSGPLFIVGSVSIAMFGSKLLGLIMLTVHILSSVFCGICFRFYGKNRSIGRLTAVSPKVENALYEAIYSSVISVLIVGGFIAVFYVLSQILADFHILAIIEKPLTPIIGANAEAFSKGLVECTTGCQLLSANKTPLSAALAAGLISFGGVSIMCQSAIYLKKARAKFSIFFLSKLIQMLFSIALCLLLLNFIPVWG